MGAMARPYAGGVLSPTQEPNADDRLYEQMIRGLGRVRRYLIPICSKPRFGATIEVSIEAQGMARHPLKRSEPRRTWNLLGPIAKKPKSRKERFGGRAGDLAAVKGGAARAS